jgi:hypothetical protein
VERFEALAQSRLQPIRQRPRAVGGGDQHCDPFGRDPVVDQPLEARLQRLSLARTGRAEQQQPRLAVHRGPALLRRQIVEPGALVEQVEARAGRPGWELFVHRLQA